MQTLEYKTKGTCSSKIRIELDGDTVVSVVYTGGCNGNLQGISKLVQGQNIYELIDRLSGIRCGFKDTSCPDQLARALKQAIAERENNA